MTELVIEGRDVATDHRLTAWRELTEPALTYNDEDGEYTAQILPGAPDRGEEHVGFTLYWTDNVLGEWAEHYTDFATALARLAALARGASRDQFFTEGPIGFVRWSENFFRQALTPPPSKPLG